MSAGASGPVGGLSFGSSKVDKECRSMALANEFIGMGNYEAAAKVLCSLKSAKAAGLTMDDCHTFTCGPVHPGLTSWVILSRPFGTDRGG